MNEDFDLYMMDVLHEKYMMEKSEKKERENMENEIVIQQDVVDKIIEFNKLKKEMEYQENLLKEGLMSAMQKVGMEHFSINGLSATIRKGSTKTTLDSKKLKLECPDIWEAYSVTTETNPCLVLSVND